MRSLELGQGEPVSVDASWRSLASLIHCSDLHICDAQSPSRVTYLDRYADPDMASAADVGYVGVYRAQEMLTTQVLASMVEATNAISVGPSGAPIEAVVITGDTVDNAQGNEIDWYRTLLDGGAVHPSSGDPDVWEGVGGPQDPDERYWHPEGGADDLPRRLHGFPTIPGFFAAAQRTIHSPGLRHQWLAIHGNHDALLQGVTAPDAVVDVITTGDRMITQLPEGTDATRLILDFAPIGPATFPLVEGAPTIEVTPDPRRAFIRPGDYAAAHLECGHDHGFTADNVRDRTAYWTRNLNDHVMLVALDTVNRHGGWHGCVDRVQLAWLRGVLERADRYVILMSHHPVDTLVNGHAVREPEPALAAEVVELLLEFPKVVLWLAGHTHKHEITYVGPGPESGFWHVRTASLIDWPQQSRVIELLDTGDRLAIATYVFDHNGSRKPDTQDLSDNDTIAGLSRWLAANNWQRQEGEHVLDSLEGQPADRNVVLHLSRR
jgi:metallophosphoesterase (TIGR03767 family)